MAQKIREWKERKEAAARGEAPAETEMEAEEEEPLYQKEEVSFHIVTCIVAQILPVITCNDLCLWRYMYIQM